MEYVKPNRKEERNAVNKKKVGGKWEEWVIGIGLEEDEWKGEEFLASGCMVWEL